MDEAGSLRDDKERSLLEMIKTAIESTIARNKFVKSTETPSGKFGKLADMKTRKMSRGDETVYKAKAK